MNIYRYMHIQLQTGYKVLFSIKTPSDLPHPPINGVPSNKTIFNKYFHEIVRYHLIRIIQGFLDTSL